MSDSISKRFIQEVLIERISNLNAEGEKSIQTARELIRFKKFVDGITPIRAEIVHGWIPVSERLPKKDERVLVTAWGDVDIAWIDKYGLWQTEEYTYHSQDDVLAWMPLPEPYREEQSDES